MKEIIKKKMSCGKKNADAYDKKVLLQITHAILNRMRYEILKYIRWKWVCVNWDMDRKKIVRIGWREKKRMIMKIILWMCEGWS